MRVLDVFFNDMELSMQEQQSWALKLQKKKRPIVQACSVYKCIMNTKFRRHVYPFRVFLYPFQVLFLQLISSIYMLFPS